MGLFSKQLEAAKAEINSLKALVAAILAAGVTYAELKDDKQIVTGYKVTLPKGDSKCPTCQEELVCAECDDLHEHDQVDPAETDDTKSLDRKGLIAKLATTITAKDTEIKTAKDAVTAVNATVEQRVSAKVNETLVSLGHQPLSLAGTERPDKVAAKQSDKKGLARVAAVITEDLKRGGHIK